MSGLSNMTENPLDIFCLVNTTASILDLHNEYTLPCNDLDMEPVRDEPDFWV